MRDTSALIGSRIRNARERLGVKQGELAERLGKTQTAISQWEGGKRSPSLEDLVSIAQALDQPLISLLPDDRPARPVRALMRAVVEPLEDADLAAGLEGFVASAEGMPALPVQIEVPSDRPLRAAQQLLSRAQGLGLSSHPPIDIRRIATYCGVRIIERSFADAVSGVLIDLDGRPTIGVNEDQHENRRRFTVAHELGHYLLRHHDRFHVDLGSPADHGDPPFSDLQLEREANDFAANVLMPASLVRDASMLNPSVEPLAKKFEVSQLAMGYRLIALGLR